MNTLPEERIDGSKEELLRGLEVIKNECIDKLCFYKRLLDKTNKAIKKIKLDNLCYQKKQ